MDPYNQGAPGYPSAPGYPAPGSGYPPQGGYPAPGGYPGQPGGYPPAAGGYPPASGGYPSAPGGYPPASGGYPPQQPGGYPPSQGFPGPAQYGASTQPNKQFIPGGLTPGRLINITVTPGPSKFAVNLRHAENGDIAFHFNPRLPDRVVVRNTCVNGGWQQEERQQPSFPFVAGQQCNIMILCEQNQFKVAVNGQHFTEYRLRTGGLHLIQFVEVDGDINVGSVRLQIQ